MRPHPPRSLTPKGSPWHKPQTRCDRAFPRKTSGRDAANGFIALRELDADGDGRITPNDPGFSRLVVWSDRDGDRRSSAGEIAPATAFELLSIDLDYVVAPRCDRRGNCEVERASFRYRDAAGVERTGAVVDIHLAAQHE
jgi:hypothetical protein